jgi:hypothetical protein
MNLEIVGKNELDFLRYWSLFLLFRKLTRVEMGREFDSSSRKID